MQLGDRCRKLAWSKFGGIASVTNNSEVQIQAFYYDSTARDYVLSQPKRLDFPKSPPRQPIQHLSWNKNGSDLVAVDVAGNILIFSLLVAINRLKFTRSFASDETSFLGQVVGMEWLSHTLAV